MRRISILVLILALLTLACSESQNAFKFVFMTDIHVQPEKGATEGLTAAIHKVNDLAPDFVITGGDLIYDALGQTYERADSLYNLYLKTIEKLNMPIYHTIGNHEIFGLYSESGISPHHPSYGKALFRQKIQDQTYRSFDHKGWHFMLLDGIGFTPERKYYGVIDSTQMEWIKNDLLQVEPSTPVVISTHIPFTTVWGQMQNGPTYAAGPGSVVTNAKDVLQLFNGHNLKLVLQGHLHEVEEINFRGITFITGGAVCGGWWKGDRDGFPEGFAVFDVKGDAFTWHYQTFGWDAKKYVNGE